MYCSEWPNMNPVDEWTEALNTKRATAIML